VLPLTAYLRRRALTLDVSADLQALGTWIENGVKSAGSSLSADAVDEAKAVEAKIEGLLTDAGASVSKGAADVLHALVAEIKKGGATLDADTIGEVKKALDLVKLPFKRAVSINELD
jgi:hypothetical protein